MRQGRREAWTQRLSPSIPAVRTGDPENEEAAGIAPDGLFFIMCIRHSIPSSRCCSAQTGVCICWSRWIVTCASSPCAIFSTMTGER